VADVGSLLQRCGSLEAAAAAYRTSLALAPPEWPPSARLLASLGALLRELWERGGGHSSSGSTGAGEHRGGGRVQRSAAPAVLARDSLSLLEAASARRPDDPLLRFQVGTAAYLFGDAAAAVRAYTAACDAATSAEATRSPGNGAGDGWPGVAPVLNNLATLAMDEIHRTGDGAAKYALLQAAIGLLRESALREPDAPCTLANLAGALWTNLTLPLQQAAVEHALRQQGLLTGSPGTSSGGGSSSASGGGDSAAAKEQRTREIGVRGQRLGAMGAAPAGGSGGSRITGGARGDTSAGGFGPRIPCGSWAERLACAEVELVLSRALKVLLPLRWPHTDQLWVRLAVLQADAGKPSAAAATCLAALRAGRAAGFPLPEAEAGGRASAPHPPPLHADGASPPGGPLGYPPAWWAHVVHLLGNAVAVHHTGLGASGHKDGPSPAPLSLACELPPRAVDARAVLAEAAALVPPNAMLQAELGKAMLRAGLVDDGARQLERALASGDAAAAHAASSPPFPSGSTSARSSGSSSTGGSSTIGDGKAWPGRAGILHALGSVHGMAGDHDRAIALFREALACDGASDAAVTTRFLLARALAERGDEAAALDELERAVAKGLWVGEQLLKGSAFDELQNHPRFLLIKEKMANNTPR